MSFHGHTELVPVSRETYGQVVKALRGDRDFMETFSVISAYTRCETNEHGVGRCVETVWGLGAVPMFGYQEGNPGDDARYFAHWAVVAGVTAL